MWHNSVDSLSVVDRSLLRGSLTMTLLQTGKSGVVVEYGKSSELVKEGRIIKRKQYYCCGRGRALIYIWLLRGLVAVSSHFSLSLDLFMCLTYKVSLLLAYLPLLIHTFNLVQLDFVLVILPNLNLGEFRLDNKYFFFFTSMYTYIKS